MLKGIVGFRKAIKEKPKTLTNPQSKEHTDKWCKTNSTRTNK